MLKSLGGGRLLNLFIRRKQVPASGENGIRNAKIPINTLGAVNKFLENNVPVRKRVQIAENEAGGSARVRRGPHARRRANKQVVIVQENTENVEKSH